MEKTGRNAPCPCGSGLKYKRCCEEKDIAAQAEGNALIDDLEQAMCLRVYQSMLIGVWGFFHPRTAAEDVPPLEELEDYYYEVYGAYPDPAIAEEFVLPLPPDILEKTIPVLESLAKTGDPALQLPPTKRPDTEGPENPQAP